ARCAALGDRAPLHLARRSADPGARRRVAPDTARGKARYCASGRPPGGLPGPTGGAAGGMSGAGSIGSVSSNPGAVSWRSQLESATAKTDASKVEARILLSVGARIG